MKFTDIRTIGLCYKVNLACVIAITVRFVQQNSLFLYCVDVSKCILPATCTLLSIIYLVSRCEPGGFGVPSSLLTLNIICLALL